MRLWCDYFNLFFFVLSVCAFEGKRSKKMAMQARSVSSHRFFLFLHNSLKSSAKVRPSNRGCCHNEYVSHSFWNEWKKSQHANVVGICLWFGHVFLLPRTVVELFFILILCLSSFHTNFWCFFLFYYSQEVNTQTTLNQPNQRFVYGAKLVE